MCRFTCCVAAFPGEILSLKRHHSLYSHLYLQSVAVSPRGRSGHEITAWKEEKNYSCGFTCCDLFYFSKQTPHPHFSAANSKANLCLSILLQAAD